MALSKRRLSVIVLGILIASLALRFAPLTIGIPVTVNTTTQELTAGGIVGSGSTSFNGELLDGTQYITTWMANGDSEKVVMQGQYRPLPFQAAFIRGCRYTTTLNTGLGWGPAANPHQEWSSQPGSEWA